jgi:hypothetical protein
VGEANSKSDGHKASGTLTDLKITEKDLLLDSNILCVYNLGEILPPAKIDQRLWLYSVMETESWDHL